MSDEFMRFFDEKAKSFPMHLEIGYNKVADYGILIYKRGCAADYPKARKRGEDVIICQEESCDVELVFAKAYVALKEWLAEFEGGY